MKSGKSGFGTVMDCHRERSWEIFRLERMQGSHNTSQYILSLVFSYLWSNVEPSLAICEAIGVKIIIDAILLREKRNLFQIWAALPVELVGDLIHSILQYFEALLSDVDRLNNFEPPCKISVADFDFSNLVSSSDACFIVDWD